MLNNKTGISNSTMPISIVVGIVTPNGTQVSGYGDISKANHTRVDGNTIFNIASLTKLFVGLSLMDMVNQGLIKLDDPLEKYLPANVTVPTFNPDKNTGVAMLCSCDFTDVPPGEMIDTALTFLLYH